MMPIGRGRPFLDYVLSALADAGCCDVCVIVAPDHAAMREYYDRAGRTARVRLSYAVQVGDDVNLATGVLDSRFTVQSGDSTTVTIPVSFTYAGIGAAGRQLMNSGAVPYRVNGDVTVGTVVGNFTVPYSSTGRFTAFGGASR